MTLRPLFFCCAVVACAFGGAPSHAGAKDWTIDPVHSKVDIKGKGGEHPFAGTVDKWEGTIFFDPKSLETSHVKITVDVGSIKTGDAENDLVLPTTQWLAAKAFPTATFESSEIIATGGDGYEARGDVTIRGVRRSVALPFTVDLNGQTAHARGTLSLMRTDFGVGEGVLGAQPNIAVELGVVFDLTATR